MSLFKAREFWQTRCEAEERFDHSCLKVTKLNEDYEYVITGSHQGTLRIFKPSSVLDENNVLSGYKPTDLLLEKILPSSILQISTGRLVSGSKNVQLAILQPKCVGVYTLVTREGAADHGTYNALTTMYEHKLRRSAANFTIGPFGGSQNRDFICVQSLDGLLTFYEQESFAFCCFLPNFLIPAPLIYNKRADCFITCTSSWTIESYRYKQLSECGENTKENDEVGKKVTSNWAYNLGENVLDMRCVTCSNHKESFIVLLGERNLYCLTDNGSLKFMKRFEYAPSCCTTYLLDEKLMTLVVSETNTLLIYENTTLKWSARLSILPVALDRIFLKEVAGALCLLSEEGIVQLCYLGSEPSLFSAPPLINKELDFEKADIELTCLNKIIKSSYTNDIKLTNMNSERELMVKINVNPHLNEIDTGTKQCHVMVDILPQAIFEEVHLVVTVRKPLKVEPETQYFSNLSDRIQFECKVYFHDESDVVSLDLDVYVSCISNLGVPRVITKTANLPLNLTAETVPANKDNEQKITLNINKDHVPLHILFPEFVGEHSLSVSSNAVAFKIFSNEAKPVTILLAKSSQRYRLQSDSLVSMNVLVNELVRRLKNHYRDEKDFEITFTSCLPVAKTFEYVKNHHANRRNVIRIENELSQISAQFRVIQKRLLAKFKDKNPTPLTNLETLLNDTFNEITELVHELETERDNLQRSQINLACVLRLNMQLLQLSDNKKELKLIENAFSSYIYDLDGQNWEDTCDAALCYLLRTVLSKSEKDRLRAAHTSFDEVKDITKFEKHFITVMERLLKKNANYEYDLNRNEVVNVENKEEDQQENKELLPIGSRFGESSSRALSARRSLLKRRNKVVEDHSEAL